MSTPHPLEEAAQTQEGYGASWDPWQGQPEPRWYDGMQANEDTAYLGPLYRVLEAAGSGAAKGEALMAGTWHLGTSALANIAEAVHAPAAGALRSLERTNEEVEEDARARVKAMTPDPATTGAALNIVHGLGEGAYLASTGALVGGPVGGAALLGGSQGLSRYQELREQGVDPQTAAVSGTVTGLTSAAGVAMPAGFGSTLASRLLTGAASNIALGGVNRYTDHKVLSDAGYPQMADQQKTLDGAQVLTDGLLGAAFGGLAHLQAHAAPGAEDAARAVNLAVNDRKLAPGIPADPEAAGAHQAALEKATSDLLQGKPVDVSDTGVDKAAFVSRPQEPVTDAQTALVHALRESGYLDEETQLKALEDQLAERHGEKPAEPPPDVEAEKIPANRMAVDPNLRADMEGFKTESGWFQTGGRVLMDEEGNVTGRTSWIPNQDWWQGRPGAYSEEDTHAIIDKALAGKRLGPKQQELVDYLTEISDQRRAVAPYMPEEGEAEAHGLSGTVDEHEGALVARAASIDEGEVESLAKQHEGNDAAFMAAIRKFLDGHDQNPEAPRVGEEHQPAPEGPRAPQVTGALEDRPHLEIPDELGNETRARDELARANVADEKSSDIPKAVKAAVDCFARRG